MYNFTKFLCEKTWDLGSIKKHIKVKIDVESTTHSSERQGRHGNDYIEDDEILKTLNKSLEEVAKNSMYGKISINDNIHIYDSNNDLNLICELDFDGKNLVLRAVTVIRKPNFKSRPSDFKIQV